VKRSQNNVIEGNSQLQQHQPDDGNKIENSFMNSDDEKYKNCSKSVIDKEK
jgi:hypothetical protein